MTTSQETVSDTALRDGEAYSYAMQQWVDNWYYAFGQILIIQRDLVKSCFAATWPVFKTVTSWKN